MARSLRRLAVTVAVVVCSAPAPSASGQALPVPITGPDPALAEVLDAVVAQAPPDTCLRVAVDGIAIYDHRGSDLKVPASTEKLLTASAVLATLDPASRLRTELVTTAPIVDGIVNGDLVLVGGGDPVLTTSVYRSFRRQPEGQATTSLDVLVDQLSASGIREVRGRVLVDDGRYDSLRTVPSWPSRYLDQDQAGPLGALVIDDGFQLVPEKPPVEGEPPPPLKRVRAGDPALAAGDALAALLVAAGIPAGTPEGSARRARPEGATVLASVESPPLEAIVADMLLRSDNQIAELLLKELGLATEGRGETAAGARAVAAWAAANDAASPGATVVDGSGLDPGNATSCQGLVAALDASGLDSPIGRGLPVAGRTGTLAGRFGDTAAVDRLHAKTGSLGSVSSLAGFVELPEGATATFAFIANGEIGDATAGAETFLAEALASWRPPCPKVDDAPTLLAPQVGATLALAATPGAGLGAAGPGLALTIAVLEDPEVAPLDRCSSEGRVPVELGIG